MEFRPCIDIHNGKVRQIVGGSLSDKNNKADVNFTADQDAAFFADLYKRRGIRGGHIIMLNPVSSEYYRETKEQALAALGSFPGGLQIGGGINPDNAGEFLDAGASHVILTSYVFQGGRIHYDRISRLKEKVGKEHLVLDLSCRLIQGEYRIVTDRWQNVSEEIISMELLDILAESCDEFLIHAVDVEGRTEGIERELAAFLGNWGKIPITYAGGVHDFADLKLLKEFGKNRLNVTIGSALDLFGGTMPFEEVLAYIANSI